MGNTESSHRNSRSSSEWASGFPTERHFLQAVARSLSRGCSGDRKHHIARRPPLPTELVLLIFRTVGALTLCRELCCTFPKSVSHRSFSATSSGMLQHSVSITASDSTPVRRLLFASPVVEREMLHRLACLRVDTVSKDQGWVSDPLNTSHSWIEVSIFRLSDLAREEIFDPEPLFSPRDSTQSSTKDKAWESHRHPVAGKQFTLLEGRRFGPEHEIWSTLQAGDRIGVWLCAEDPAWECRARAARLTVHEWFEPTLL